MEARLVVAAARHRDVFVRERNGHRFPAGHFRVQAPGAVHDQVAALAFDEVTIGGCVGGERGGVEDVGIASVEEFRHPQRGVGGQTLDVVAGTGVEGADRVVDGLVADPVDGLVGRGDQFAELLTEVVGNFQRLVPGDPYEQYQGHHLDRDEHQDQAHPYRETVPVMKDGLHVDYLSGFTGSRTAERRRVPANGRRTRHRVRCRVLHVIGFPVRRAARANP